MFLKSAASLKYNTAGIDGNVCLGLLFAWPTFDKGASTILQDFGLKSKSIPLGHGKTF